MKLRRVLLAVLAATAGSLMGVTASPASAASGWTSLSSGEAHTCGIRGGRIYCWGNDAQGQLGDGTAGGSRAVPEPIASGATDWTSVSAGALHTCAIRIGRVACWGFDAAGQLGDGTAAGAADPSPGFIASGASDWKSLTAGGYHTCAIRAGRVACWGNDVNGQLGDGASGATPDASPGFISSGAADWTSVSAGSLYTCAIRTGRVACWGNDQYGQLGDGTAGATPDASPGFIASGASDWTSVSTGINHTCAIRTGRVACWGNDKSGQLGDGTAGATPEASPGFIASGATDWTSVSAGGAHTCATRVGRIACWGHDVQGQLGDGTASDVPDPSPGFISSGATDWKRVEVGDYHSCAIRATLLACWGYDFNGQLGDGSGGTAFPDPVPNLEVS